MSYTITLSDGVTTINVPGNSKNVTSTSITLHGRGQLAWGQERDEDLVHILENFASDTPPANPIVGQLWYDTGTGSPKGEGTLKIYRGVGSPAWEPLLGTTTASTIFVDLAGDTMSGFLTLSADPVNNLHAATKQYVDGEIATTVGALGSDDISDDSGIVGTNVTDVLTLLNTSKLNLSGGTMSGTLTLNADPVANLQAATKQYVDNATTGVGPTFLSSPIVVESNYQGTRAWTSVNVTAQVPSTAKALILQIDWAMDRPDGFGADAFVYARENSSGTAYVVARGRAAASEDVAGNTQSIIPWDSGAGTFDYTITPRGFTEPDDPPGGVNIRVIGYWQ